jgi:hypothetical protein
VWPQVMKLDVLPASRPFDFIGRVEHLQEDMDTLLGLLRVNRTSSRIAINPSSHARDRCGKQISVPPQAKEAAVPLLCDLLRADFTCFGYPTPSVCAGAEAETGAEAEAETGAGGGEGHIESRSTSACSLLPSQAATLASIRALTPTPPSPPTTADDEIGGRAPAPSEDGARLIVDVSTGTGTGGGDGQEQLGRGGSLAATTNGSDPGESSGASFAPLALMPGDRQPPRDGWATPSFDRGQPKPFENATELGAGWMAPHVQSFHRLSQRARKLIASESRDRFLSRGPTLLRLSQCGSLAVPFGGAMLSEFELHLRRFVIRAEPQGGRSQNSSWAQHGYFNSVYEYVPLDEGAAAALKGHGPLVVRGIRYSPQRPIRDAATRCRYYRVAVWNGYTQWILGELDVFPRVVFAWLTWSHRSRFIAIRAVVEKWRGLVELLSAPPHGLGDGFALASELVGRFDAFTRSAGLLALDIKPRDMLARCDGRGLCSTRLSDIELSASSNFASSWSGVPVPFLSPPCARMLSMQMSTTMLACGPLRNTSVARRFVDAALGLIDAPLLRSNSNWSLVVMGVRMYEESRGRASHARLLCEQEEPSDDLRRTAPRWAQWREARRYDANATADEDDAIDGWMGSRHAFLIYAAKTVADNNRRVSIHSLHFKIYQRWSQGHTPACPPEYAWD